MHLWYEVSCSLWNKNKTNSISSIPSEHPWMVDLVLLHLPSCVDPKGYYLLSAWWRGNQDCRTWIWGHRERVFGRESWLWSWHDRSFSCSAYWLHCSLLRRFCFLSQIPQLPEKMNGAFNRLDVLRRSSHPGWRVPYQIQIFSHPSLMLCLLEEV